MQYQFLERHKVQATANSTRPHALFSMINYPSPMILPSASAVAQKKQWYQRTPILYISLSELLITSSLTVIRGRHAKINAHLVPNEVVERRPVAEVDPVAGRRALLFVLSVAEHHPVVPLRSGYRGRQPDLLVGRLLVDHVGALAGEVDG